jgi:hypothetical protein
MGVPLRLMSKKTLGFDIFWEIWKREIDEEGEGDSNRSERDIASDMA